MVARAMVNQWNIKLRNGFGGYALYTVHIWLYRKAKRVVHTTGGYMVCQYSFENVFQYTQGDIYWCTADIGWITGHSYIVYGLLLAGATTLMFEGVPTFRMLVGSGPFAINTMSISFILHQPLL